MKRISGKGTLLTKQIESSKYHVYVNFSKQGLCTQINRMAKLTDKQVHFERW